jgi:hypothetical protein
LVGAGSVALDLMQRLVSRDGRNFFHGRAAFREPAHLCAARAAGIPAAGRVAAMLASQPFNGFGWKSLIGKTGSRPSIRCTADPAKADKRTRSSGAGLCGTPPRTSRTPNRWTG